MRRSDRRKAGLTVAAVIKAARECKQQGKFTDEMSDGEIAAAIATQWAGNLQLEDPELDWDAIIAFIEQLLALLKIFGVL